MTRVATRHGYCRRRRWDFRTRVSGVDARRAGARQVTVLEGSPEVGGKLRRESVAGVPIDVGAEAILARRPEATNLIDELGLTSNT